jgi:cell wall-associated NlpC family hydrolase
VTLARTPRRTRAAATLAAALALSVGAVLSPTTATAAPGSSAEAARLVEQAAQKLTVIGEQVHAAEDLVAEQRAHARAAATTAAEAEAALAAFEPQLRAIAQSGYTGRQTQVAAFLTSDSADDLVQQMTTLDMIADHTDAVVGLAAAAQRKAEAAQAEADAAMATAKAGLAELEKQKAQMQAKVDEYEAAFDRLSAQEQARVTARVAGPTLARPSFADLGIDPDSAVATVIKTALSKVGSPYVYGATGPNSFDCSGLTGFAYAAAGIDLPRSSREQARVGTPVSRSELQPGDLVFFYSPIGHVGIYLGGGRMVHARMNGQPVAVTSVDMAGYNMAVRVIG